VMFFNIHEVKASRCPVRRHVLNHVMPQNISHEMLHRPKSAPMSHADTAPSAGTPMAIAKINVAIDVINVAFHEDIFKTASRINSINTGVRSIINVSPTFPQNSFGCT